MITLQDIGRKLAQLRKQKGFSQQDIATYLNISRSSVTQMEAGKRKISIPEFVKLAEFLQFSLDEFIHKQEEELSSLRVQNASQSPLGQKQDMRVSVPKLNLEKFKNILLYILERCAGKPNVGETVLYKLLYFADFNYYELYEEHLSGATYRKLPYGPVPQNLKSILLEMVDQKKIQRIKAPYHGYQQTRYIPLEQADLTKMNAAEKEMIDKVIDQFSDWSAKAISDYSHKDIPWLATKDKEIIDYELAFYRTPPYSARTYQEEENNH